MPPNKIIRDRGHPGESAHQYEHQPEEERPAAGPTQAPSREAQAQFRYQGMRHGFPLDEKAPAPRRALRQTPQESTRNEGERGKGEERHPPTGPLPHRRKVLSAAGYQKAGDVAESRQGWQISAGRVTGANNAGSIDGELLGSLIAAGARSTAQCHASCAPPYA